MPDQANAPIQVVYVEDSALHATLLKAGLSVFNIEVIHVAKGGENLIQELARSRYDSAKAIILDLNIGEFNGLQVARRLRASGDNRPLLLISTSDKPGNRELMSIQAMFISKPFDFERISEAIKKLASQQ
jgi:DNA-binding response OmpR family regulator